MDRDYLKEYVEENRVDGKKNFYSSSRSAETASTIYEGLHYFHNTSTGDTDCWFTGKVMRFGV